MLKLGVEAVKEILMRRRHLSKGMKEVRERAMWLSERRVPQAEGTASVKALRWVYDPACLRAIKEASMSRRE